MCKAVLTHCINCSESLKLGFKNAYILINTGVLPGLVCFWIPTFAPLDMAGSCISPVCGSLLHTGWQLGVDLIWKLLGISETVVFIPSDSLRNWVSIFVVVVLGSHLTVFRADSWFWAKGSLPAVLREPYVVPGWAQGDQVQGRNPTHCTVTWVLRSWV